MPPRPLTARELRALSEQLGELGTRAQALLKDGEHEATIELLSAHCAAPDANPVAMVLLANALVTDAFEVMFDRIEENATQALDWLARAHSRGFVSPAVERWEVSLQRALASERRQRVRVEARAEKILAGGAGKLKAFEIATSAHALSKRCDYARASRLFRLAAERAAQEPPPIVDGKPRYRNDFNHLIRALICAVEAGELDGLEAEIDAALAFDWQAGGIPEDSHMNEVLFVVLLEQAAAARHWQRFRSLWQRATSRGDELRQPFPHSHQEKLLDLCNEEALRDLLPRVVDRIRASANVPTRLAAKLERMGLSLRSG
jgi:hypothetical protein